MATTKRVIIDGPQHVVVYGSYDGDVSDEVLIDVSTLTPVPTHLAIEQIWYTVGGQNVTIEFDATTDEPAWAFGGADATGALSGCIDFTNFGGLKDPKASGFTGDIIVTTGTFDAGEPCKLVIKARKFF